MLYKTKRSFWYIAHFGGASSAISRTRTLHILVAKQGKGFYCYMDIFVKFIGTIYSRAKEAIFKHRTHTIDSSVCANS